jgi:hypothetical protein
MIKARAALAMLMIGAVTVLVLQRGPIRRYIAMERM